MQAILLLLLTSTAKFSSNVVNPSISTNGGCKCAILLSFTQSLKLFLEALIQLLPISPSQLQCKNCGIYLLHSITIFHQQVKTFLSLFCCFLSIPSVALLLVHVYVTTWVCPDRPLGPAAPCAVLTREWCAAGLDLPFAQRTVRSRCKLPLEWSIKDLAPEVILRRSSS